MILRSKIFAKLWFVFCSVFLVTLLNINKGYGEWVARQGTMGEGSPEFVASNISSDQTMELIVALAPDGNCYPSLDIRYQYKKIDSDTIKKIFIQSGDGDAIELPFYKSNYFLLTLDNGNGPFVMDLLQSLQAAPSFKLIMRFGATEMIKVFNRGDSSMAMCSIQASCWSSLMDGSDYLFPTSHKKPMTTHGLCYLPKGALKIARNEIFARHGYRFKGSRLHAYFSKKKWYQPHQVTIALTEMEKRNIALISLAEKSIQMPCPDIDFGH